MSTTIEADTPHTAVISALALFDANHHDAGQATLLIERPANLAIDLPASPFSPLTDFVAALTFIGMQRRELETFAMCDLAHRVGMDQSGGATFRLNGDEVSFVKPLRESFLGMSVQTGSQLLFLKSSDSYAMRPLPEKLVTYGMIHALMAEATGNLPGRAFYHMDRFWTAQLPPVLTANSETVYSAECPYPFAVRAAAIVDRRYDLATWLQDAAMLTTEGVVVGLRHSWMRRVAVPIVMAHTHLKRNDKRQTALDAVAILRQCSDPMLRAAYTSWIERRYGLTAADKENGLA